MTKHKDAASIHLGAIFEEADPVTLPDVYNVRPGMLWVDKAIGPPHILKIRNDADDGWAVATGGAGTGPLMWEGPWSGSTGYFINDVTSYAGSSWVAILNHTNHRPDISPTYWQMLAQRGANGPKGLNWRAAWSSVTAYVIDDAVQIGGRSYIAILDSTNQSPPNATYWSLMAERGDDGIDGSDFAYIPSTQENEALPTRGASATASSADTGHAASLAIDNMGSTNWRTPAPSTNVGEYLQIDLGSAKAITAIRVAGGIAAAQGPLTWTIQSSTTGVGSWIDRYLGTGDTDTGIRQLDAPITARYWRIIGVTDQGAISNPTWAIAALELYSGSPGTGGVDQSVVTINFIIDGGSDPIEVGIKGDMVIDFDAEIIGWTLLADQSGSVVVDVWRDTFDGFPPQSTDSLPGTSHRPSITSSNRNKLMTLTGWNSVFILNGDILRYYVQSATTIRRLTFALKLKRQRRS